LFTRFKGGLTPDKYALELYPIVQNMLNLQTSLFSLVANKQHSDTINIAIYPIPLCKTIVYLTKALFNQLYPYIHINILDYDTSFVPNLQQYSFIIFPTRFYSSFKQSLTNSPHLKVEQLFSDSFCLVYNSRLELSPNNRTNKISHLFSVSLKKLPFFSDKEAIAHLKKLGIIYDKPITYLDATSYDDILNFVSFNDNYAAILPQNFIRPYNKHLEYLKVVDMNFSPVKHYIAYNHIALNQYPEAQTFLDMLKTEAKKYS